MESRQSYVDVNAPSATRLFVTCGDVREKDCVICYAAELHPNVTPAGIADQVARLCNHKSEEGVDHSNREDNDG